ncbi:MAG: 4-(cytidine 5'-diphospho)-2-C-methyl-D-erythritol kinase [Erysipelotrichaceae bacterium]|nr:4-(cytidine 5'-diphospho)-2-C-methyl-D-erythritol kinase [Erysipelotrichaceae bacterium]
MKIKAYAKINLALKVVNKRDDGYHDLKMIMVPITLHDLIYIDKTSKGIIIKSNSSILPTNKSNIMYQIVTKMQKLYNLSGGVEIFIYKHIPTQAGLGGGSADGAAILHAMNQLYELNLTNEQLANIGKEVGADIPFCVYNQMAYVEGIGEKLSFIDNDFRAHILLVKPRKGVSTKKAFENLRFDQIGQANLEEMVDAIEADDYPNIIANMTNSLEENAMKSVREIKEIKAKLIELGFDNALMTGSGSCVFGITRNEEVLEAGDEYFSSKNLYVRKTELLSKK